MGIAQGYGRTAGGDSLVFAYDTGDTRNSYIGEPTTNLINPASLGIYSWWTRAVQTLETLTETYYGQPIYRLSLSLDTDEQRDYARSSGGAGTAWYAQYLTYQANTAYIASVIYRPVSHSDMTVKGHPSNISGWGLNFNDSINLSNGWKRHRIDRNYGATVGDNKYYHLWAPSANTGDVLVIDITGNQIEQKDHLTPFINGTRSATQGLIDLVGNSTIDLSAVSFDSNAQMTFDGTNDYVDLGSYLTNLDTSTLSIELVFKSNTVTGDALNLIGWMTGESPHGYICTGNFTGMWGNESISFFNFSVGEVGHELSFAYTNGHSFLNDTNYHHVVFTLQNADYRIYVDGVQVAVNASFRNGSSSSPMTSNLFGYGSTPSVEIGAGSNPANYANVKVPITKIYNRVLTEDEILNNYRHYKSRFNI